MALVLARGVGDLVAEEPRPAAPPSPRGAAEFSESSEARAFAVRFARSYLTVEPGDEQGARRLSSLVSASLSDQAAPIAPPRGPGAEVADATVAREISLGESRALITVAAFMRDGQTRYLTVPVARDGAGGLVVYDLPALSAPPAAGRGDAPAVAQLSGPDGEAVADLAGRFLRVYLHGGSQAELAYLLAPGAHAAPLGAGLSVEAVEEVGRLGAAGSRSMQVVATVRVRDKVSGASYWLRYRLAVEQHDRWLVRSVAGGPQS